MVYIKKKKKKSEKKEYSEEILALAGTSKDTPTLKPKIIQGQTRVYLGEYGSLYN